MLSEYDAWTLDIDFCIKFSIGLHSLSTSYAQSVDNLWIHCISITFSFILLGFYLWETSYPQRG